MPQRVIVDADNNVRIIDVGPMGPPGRGLPGPQGDPGAKGDPGDPGVIAATGAASLSGQVVNVPIDGLPSVGTARTLGSGSQQAMPGDANAQASLPGGISISPELSDWYERFRNSKTTPTSIVWITDSIGASGSNETPAHPWLATRELNSIIGAPNYIYPVFAQGDGNLPVATTTDGTYSQTGLGGHSSLLSNSQTVTHMATCRAWKVTYVDTGTGTLTFRDGAGGSVLGTVTMTNTGKLRVWSSAVLPLLPRTLHITSTGNTNVGQIIPLNDNAVISYMATHSGYNSANYTSDPAKALDLIEHLNDIGELGLVVVATGANDSPYSVMMPPLLEDIQERTSADIALWVCYPSTAVGDAEYSLMHPFALNLGLPLIDPGTVYSRFAYTNTVDGTHPTPEGQKILADIDVMVLSGDPLGRITQQLTQLPKIGTRYNQAAPGNIFGRIRGETYSREDEFMFGSLSDMNNIGDLGWTLDDGSASDPVLDLHGHPGAVRIQQSVAGTPASLHLPMRTGGITQSGAGWRLAFWFRHGAMSATSKIHLGMAMSGAFIHGTVFEKEGSGNWFGKTSYLGTGIDNIDSGITTAQNVWNLFELVGFGPTTLMYINGTMCGMLPSTIVATPNLTVVDTGGTALYLDIDRFQFAMADITRDTDGVV